MKIENLIKEPSLNVCISGRISRWNSHIHDWATKIKEWSEIKSSKIEFIALKIHQKIAPTSLLSYKFHNWYKWNETLWRISSVEIFARKFIKIVDKFVVSLAFVSASLRVVVCDYASPWLHRSLLQRQTIETVSLR